MWFFLRRRGQAPVKSKHRFVADVPTEPKRFTYADLVAGMGDFADLASHEIALKFWLPEPMERALEYLAGQYQVSLSMMVRILLVDYVYGRYALLYMQQNQLGLFRRRDGPMFSRAVGPSTVAPSIATRVYRVPELGKNIAPIKVFIAQRLKRDLMVLADHADVLLSRFVREIIIGEVLGRGTVPERPELHTMSPSPACEAWEQGQEVAMRVVSRDEIGELTDYEVTTT